MRGRQKTFKVKRYFRVLTGPSAGEAFVKKTPLFFGSSPSNTTLTNRTTEQQLPLSYFGFGYYFSSNTFSHFDLCLFSSRVFPAKVWF